MKLEFGGWTKREILCKRCEGVREGEQGERWEGTGCYLGLRPEIFFFSFFRFFFRFFFERVRVRVRVRVQHKVARPVAKWKEIPYVRCDLGLCPVGFEPTTSRLLSGCSANWAKGADACSWCPVGKCCVQACPCPLSSVCVRVQKFEKKLTHQTPITRRVALW